MTFEIEINGRTRAVAIERTTGGHYRVSLDGSAHDFDVARIGAFGLSLIDGEAGISREVQVTPGGSRGGLLISLGGRTVSGSVNGRRSGRAGADTGAGATGNRPFSRRCRDASSASW